MPTSPLNLKGLTSLLTSGLTGFAGTLASLFFDYLFSWLARKGVYVVNVGLTEIQTNLDRKQWEAIASAAWTEKEQLDAGTLILTPEERKAKSQAFRRTFRKFATYTRVLKP